MCELAARCYEAMSYHGRTAYVVFRVRRGEVYPVPELVGEWLGNDGKEGFVCYPAEDVVKALKCRSK